MSDIKSWARSLVFQAVKRGVLTKGACSVCGAKEVEGHHKDYSKPLEVEWLCKAHHLDEHRRYSRQATPVEPFTVGGRKPTYDELLMEFNRLKSKLSPLEDKEFTAFVRDALTKELLMPHYQEHNYSVTATAADIWFCLFGEPGNTREVAKLGRSLLALGWVRGAQRGVRTFSIPVEEL